MRLKPTERRRRLPAPSILMERRPTKELLEVLDFIQPGDLRVLEKIALDPFAEKRDIQAAFCLPALLYPGSVLSPDFKASRQVYVTDLVDQFEPRVRDESVFETRDRLVALLNPADQILPFRHLLSELPSAPNQAVWDGVVGKVKEYTSGPHDRSVEWLFKLLCVDPVRFRQLPAEEIWSLCFTAIAQERQNYPTSKDKRQIRLLNRLTTARLMFPDSVHPEDLSDQERAVTRVYLEQERTRAKVEGGSGFAHYLYILSLVEAPSLRVDEFGIHLSSSSLMEKTPALPERPQV